MVDDVALGARIVGATDRHVEQLDTDLVRRSGSLPGRRWPLTTVTTVDNVGGSGRNGTSGDSEEDGLRAQQCQAQPDDATRHPGQNTEWVRTPE